MNNRDLIMIQTRKKYCIWALAATFGLLSALNLGSLHAANIKWHPGLLPQAGVPKIEAVSVGKHQLTSQGFAIRGYVLLGWSNRGKPVVKTQAAQNHVRPLYRVGDSLDVQADMTLIAVWAIDANNDGIPDYQAGDRKLTTDPEYVKKILAELEAKRRAAEGGTAHRSSLRSASVSLPAWNIHDDMLAHTDRVYYVGCPYNTDTTSTHKIDEPLIYFGADIAFPRERADSLIAEKDMELVFEYGGVLEDTCLVGGKAQKAISRIPFLKPRGTARKDTVYANELFSCDPMMFTRIKEDGMAVLKLYFVKKGTDSLVNAYGNDTSYFRRGGSGGAVQGFGFNQHKPFINEETGEPSDTLTFRFRIYNQPEFAATSISTDILYGDTIYLKYAHLRGTPTKYMMRSFDGGWNWHPADSPLTDVERDLLQGDSVRICLRQLDKAVGWAVYQKEVFMDPERYTYDDFEAGIGTNGDLNAWYSTQCEYEYYKKFYDKIVATSGYVDPMDSIKKYYNDVGLGSGSGWDSDIGTDKIKEITLGVKEVLVDLASDTLALGNPAHKFFFSMVQATGFDYLKANSEEKDLEKKNINTVFGKHRAEQIVVPAWCRNEPYCFYVSKGAVPIIERTVFIPRVEGVTVLTPELGQNSVRSQKDFTFRLKYAGKPMKVIAKRMIDGRVIGEVTGTPNADGEYEYVIRRVMQDITLEFTSADANTLVDQPSVWAYGGTLRIRSPKETTVRIYSASGLLVKQVAVHGDTTVPLAAGLYMVVLSDGTTHKVIVQ